MQAMKVGERCIPSQRNLFCVRDYESVRVVTKFLMNYDSSQSRFMDLIARLKFLLTMVHVNPDLCNVNLFWL